MVSNKNLLNDLKETIGNSIPVDLLPFLHKANEIYNERNDYRNGAARHLIKDKKNIAGLDYQNITEFESQVNELDLVLQNLNNAYISYDAINKKVLFSNYAFKKIFTPLFAQNGDSKMTFSHFIYDEDHAQYYAALSKVVKGFISSGIFRIVLADGSLMWLQARLIPVLNNHGRLSKINAIATDITFEKEFSRITSEHKRDFQKQLSGARDNVILVCDNSLVLSHASGNTVQLLGYTAENLSGKPFINFIKEEDHGNAIVFYHEVLSGNKVSATKTLRFITNKGNELYCECEIHDFRNNPLINGILTYMKDVTVYKSYELELVETINDLKNSNAGLENFVSTISHDLRAPILSMQGILEMADPGDVDENLSEELIYLKKGLNNLDKYILDLLSYSYCTKSKVTPEELHFDELLTEITDNVRFMNKDNIPIDFRKSVRNGIPFYSDRRMVHTILSNLISNAIRYCNSSNSSPFLIVAIDTTSSYALIEVADNGIGISKENQEKIFDMFYRVSTDKDGTGIGLHLVKIAVEKLSGKITLESEQNIGTKFKIIIPNIAQTQN